METQPVFTRETFRFFKDLGRHNHKEWMEANQRPLSGCFDSTFSSLAGRTCASGAGARFALDTSGRTGANFSRINRDIRFAKDKTLYKTHMYLKFSVPLGQAGNRPILCGPHNGHCDGGLSHLFGREAERVHRLR